MKKVASSEKIENLTASLKSEGFKGFSQADLFQKTFDSLTDAIFILDAEFHPRIIDCNRAASTIFGYTREEMIGKTTTFLHVDEEIMKKFKSLLYPAMEKGDICFHLPEHKMKRKDGFVFPSEHRVAQLLNDEGKRIGWVSLVRDITERKRAEEALRRSEEQARCLLEFQNKVIDTAVVWINLLDAEGNVTLWNRAAELISGYSHEEVIGHKKGWEWLYPDPKYRAKIFANAKKIIERGERVDIDETTIRCKDGTLKTISWYSNAILDERGKPVGSISVGIDITEIKKAQERIRESEEALRGIFSAMTDGITLVGLDGRIVDCNDAVLHFHGVSRDEYVGRNVYDFVAPEDRQRAIQEAFDVLKKGYLRSEVKALRKGGGTFDAEINVSLLRDASGET